MAYGDLRAYLTALERRGKLHRVTVPVEVDWEIAAVCRTVFRKIPEIRRPGLLFERVKGHEFAVAVGVLGASREIYAIALETTPDRLFEKWQRAQASPIPTFTVPSSEAPCKENVLIGDDVDLSRFPVPTWTAGVDGGPYISAGSCITIDPDSGIRNVGNYRLQVKGRARTGISIVSGNHGIEHVKKYHAQGKAAPIAVAIGCDPTVMVTAVSTIAPDVDELAVAGALGGQPMPVVRCETADIEVPATAEIVIEGEIPPGVLEPEGPFGEHTGYALPPGPNLVIDVKAITFRNNPIYHCITSQMPPSESSCIKRVAYEPIMVQHLRSLGFAVRDVYFKDAGGVSTWLVISMRKAYPEQVRELVEAVWQYLPIYGKYTVVTDDDVDVYDQFQLDWAMGFRVQPARDIWIEPDTVAAPSDPSVAGIDVPKTDPRRKWGSKIVIDATMKHPYPPIALPPKVHLEAVERAWAEYGFDGLTA